jgi:hypothetical protein
MFHVNAEYGEERKNSFLGGTRWWVKPIDGLIFNLVAMLNPNQMTRNYWNETPIYIYNAYANKYTGILILIYYRYNTF